MLNYKAYKLEATKSICLRRLINIYSKRYKRTIKYNNTKDFKRFLKGELMPQNNMLQFLT